MDRRSFLRTVAAAPLLARVAPSAAQAPTPARFDRLLILVELKGGNDGLNTVVPYADPNYYALRPSLAIARDRVLQLDERGGLHPALEALLPLWQTNSLAIVHGVGYPEANLSHFRSIEIWDTASRVDEYLADGWLTRAFAQAPVPRDFAADAAVVGGLDLGPLAGVGPRVIALANTERFLRQAALATPREEIGSSALRHILRVERDITHAAAGLNADHVFRTEFPRTAFGNAVRTASHIVASGRGAAAIKLSLNGFDTHANQVATHARLLRTLAEGLVALQQALQELGRWQSTLVMTYAEFGRRPAQNMSGGTDHGTAAVQFFTGGRVRGGIYGEPPALDRLDGNGNPAFTLDFRALYATVLERWWGMDSTGPLRGAYRSLDILRA